MPSPDNPHRGKPEIGWLGIVESFLLQVLVLLALSAGVVRYVTWSSDAAQADFTAAGKPVVSSPVQPPQPAAPAPVEVVKGQKTCPRKA
jgi:hypothetical protein